VLAAPIEVRRLRHARARFGRTAWPEVERGLVRNGWTGRAYEETVTLLAQRALDAPAAFTDSRLTDDPTLSGEALRANLAAYLAWACDGGCATLPWDVTRAWLRFMVATPTFLDFVQIRTALTDRRDSQVAPWMTAEVARAAGVLSPACWAAGVSPEETIALARAGRLSAGTLEGMAALRGHTIPEGVLTST
jgi:hypothetical protein